MLIFRTPNFPITLSRARENLERVTNTILSRLLAEARGVNSIRDLNHGWTQMNTGTEEETLALTPAQKVFVFRRDCVRSPREREKLPSAPENADPSVTFLGAAIAHSLP